MKIKVETKYDIGQSAYYVSKPILTGSQFDAYIHKVDIMAIMYMKLIRVYYLKISYLANKNKQKNMERKMIYDEEHYNQILAVARSYKNDVERLEQQLAEKEKAQNQKAIEQLERLLGKTQTLNLMVKSGHYVNEKRADVVFKDVIEQQINELKGE